MHIYRTLNDAPKLYGRNWRPGQKVPDFVHKAVVQSRIPLIVYIFQINLFSDYIYFYIYFRLYFYFNYINYFSSW